MKKLCLLIMLMTIFIIMFSQSIFASAIIDKSKASSGLVVVTFSGDISKGIKVLVEKSGTKYQYSLTSTKATNIPLQMGVGSYSVKVLESVGGKNYKPLVSETVEAGDIDEKAMYSASIPIVDYSASTKAIPAYKGIAGSKQGNEKVTTIYSDIVKNYSYDFDKASNVGTTEYVPVIDSIYASKKGICYDYAALLAGALRSQGIPTKLVMGYAPEISEYHAWNEIFTDGKWNVVDTTYDSQMDKGGAKYTFAKDASKYKVVKVY